MSYVVQRNYNPSEKGGFPYFFDKKIACASLKVYYCEADFRAINQALVSFTTVQPSGECIKDTLRYIDGRISMKSLRNKFTGEGNTTRNISKAEQLCYSIHFQNKISMEFELFLTKCQKMYNILKKKVGQCKRAIWYASS